MYCTSSILCCVESGTGSNQPRCPPGTYSNMTGLAAAAECTPCTEGYYCGNAGLTQPTAPCDEGQFALLRF